ncbi:50S ribosomal protein L22 [Candidatus Micrarchaeota archaeon]|nr:50S ribosomal protein L22 [Candidatus Micrarchaeota archaeon]MBU2476124.1 50S ribosomal protein L22 [Candidatus Micrarchaeota archaeon]
MTKKNYNLQEKINEKKTAKAIKTNANASLKYSTEISREIKGKSVKRAEEFLQNITEKKEHLPLRKYLKKVPHRKGKGQTKTGRYPQKTVKAFLELIQTAKSNADYKGLETEKLIVKHAFASMGYSRMSHQSKGKIGGKSRAKKSAHLEIVLQEGK